MRSIMVVQPCETKFVTCKPFLEELFLHFTLFTFYTTIFLFLINNDSVYFSIYFHIYGDQNKQSWWWLIGHYEYVLGLSFPKRPKWISTMYMELWSFAPWYGDWGPTIYHHGSLNTTNGLWGHFYVGRNW